jgi:hypothetical protein
VTTDEDGEGKRTPGGDEGESERTADGDWDADAPELAPFDDALVRAVAADSGLAVERLRALLAAHRSTVGAYTSVPGWVYELRRAYPRDPLVARVGGAYYLAVEPTVWREFAPALGVDAGDDAFEAVRRVHDRAFRAVATHPGDEREAMVVREL